LNLVSPPWFDAQLDGLGVSYFESQGFEVVYHSPAGLPSDQNRIDPAELYEWVRAHVNDDSDAVFIAGNGFRAVGTIEALEQDLRRPVLTANQVLFWAALRAAEARVPVSGYGEIFSR
jgi:maleate isomerase